MLIVVLDAKQTNALAIVHAIKRGNKIITGDSKKLALSNVSKYVKRRITYPEPSDNIEKFLKHITFTIKKIKPDVILPVGINTTIPLSFKKEQLSEYTNVPLATYEVLEKLHNKESCIELASKYGLHTPETYKPRTKEDLKKISKKISFPSVIKVRKGSSAKDLRYAFNPKDLVDKYYDKKYYSRKDQAFNSDSPLIQEYIFGNQIHDVCVLFNEGTPIAGLTQKRVLMYPNSGGGGIFNITTYDSELLEYTYSFLEKCKYHGVAQVEFKYNKEGIPFLIEVNTKFWGTLDLSIKAGVNFPKC